MLVYVISRMQNSSNPFMDFDSLEIFYLGGVHTCMCMCVSRYLSP